MCIFLLDWLGPVGQAMGVNTRQSPHYAGHILLLAIFFGMGIAAAAIGRRVLPEHGVWLRVGYALLSVIVITACIFPICKLIQRRIG